MQDLKPRKALWIEMDTIKACAEAAALQNDPPTFYFWIHQWRHATLRLASWF